MIARLSLYLAMGCAFAVPLAGCSDSNGGGANPTSQPPPAPPTTTIIVPGINPSLDTVTELAISDAPSGSWEPVAPGRYAYDPAAETVSLQDAIGATGTACAAWLRLQGTAMIGGETGMYTLFSYTPACGAATAANELTSLAVGLVAEGAAADFDAAIDVIAGMTGVEAGAITAPVTEAQRDPALRAAMIAATPVFRDGGFVPGETPAEDAAGDIDRCIAIGGLAYNDWTRPEAGGAGRPAAESDGDYYRCKACHGWDRLGTDGGYARRTREEGRANAGHQDPNNCVAPGDPADCTPTRNVSTDPAFGTMTTLATGWESVGGRSWQDGKAVFDGIDPWGTGTILGNRHPDLSVAGVNASDALPTVEQLRCLTAFLNHPDSWLSSAFAAIDPSVEPVLYTPAAGDATRGEAFYNDRDRGACLNCHGAPDDPDGGPFTAGPAGGLKNYLGGDGKPSELMHKVLWGEPGTFMTRAAMNAPTPGDVADLASFLVAFAAPLTAVDDSGVTTRAMPVTINVLANDRGEGRTITDFEPMSANGGTVNCADPSCVYEPPGDFTGEDQFGYTISDGMSSATATVDVTVLPPPVIATDDSATTAANVPVTIDVLANDAGDALTIVAFDTVSDAGGSVNCTTDACTFTSATDFVGIDRFSYTASDGVSEDTASVLVTVTEPAPALVAAGDTAVTEAGVAVVIDVLANDEGVGIEIVAFDPTSTNDGDVTCNTSECTYTPPPGFAGEDAFNYTISDGADSASATVTVTVEAGAPVVAADDTAFTNTDEAVLIDVLANDNGINLAIVAFDATGTSGGSVSCTAGDCTYTPPIGFAGEDSFAYTASDGLTSDVATVTVIVASTAPTVVANDDNAETPSGTIVSINVLANDVGVAITIVGFDTSSTAGGAVVCTVNACDYTPPADFSGADSFGYTAADAFTSDSATVSLTVSVVAVDDTTLTQMDTPVIVSVLSNDLGSTLTITAADTTSTAGGVVACAAGECSYSPPAGFTGTDDFGYTASDGLTQDSAQVSVTVRTAVVAADDTATTIQDTPVTIDVLINDMGDGIAIVSFDTGSIAGGTVACVGSDCLYTPPVGFTGEDSFGYTISDGFFTDSATVTVTVEPMVPVGDFEIGRLLYEADCTSCHSAGVYDTNGFAGDIAGTGSLLVNDLSTLGGAMAGLVLSDQDILDLTAFLDDPSVIGP